MTPRRHHEQRPIPAFTEKTDRWRELITTSTAHPRIHGEDVTPHDELVTVPGPSPHSRRRLRRELGSPQLTGPIPAFTEKTLADKA